MSEQQVSETSEPCIESAAKPKSLGRVGYEAMLALVRGNEDIPGHKNELDGFELALGEWENQPPKLREDWEAIGEAIQLEAVRARTPTPTHPTRGLQYATPSGWKSAWQINQEVEAMQAEVERLQKLVADQALTIATLRDSLALQIKMRDMHADEVERLRADDASRDASYVALQKQVVELKAELQRFRELADEVVSKHDDFERGPHPDVDGGPMNALRDAIVALAKHREGA